MNKEKAIVKFEIKLIKKHKAQHFFDFYIDDKPLSKKLKIDRFDLAYSNFDLDTLVIDKDKFPHYNRSIINKTAVSNFLGETKPMNQFRTNRIVIYRCHCGSDFCGVISFELLVKKNCVIWKNISYESDYLNNSSENIETLHQLVFNRNEYELAFKNYLKTNNIR